MNNIFKTCTLLIISSIILTGCSSQKFFHGYMANPKLVKAIRPKIDNEDSVRSMLGSPTAKATFTQLTWYYYAKRSERTAFFKKEITSLDIVAVKFTPKGYVEKVVHYNMDNYNEITPNDDKTITYGKELNFLSELFGNIGRFGAGGVPQSGN